jgi:2',3'-cyclic-nucleotide 2'-phosphodiesterase (5'-nucleotidase family)
VEKVQKDKQRVLVVDSGDLFFHYQANGEAEKDLKKARLIGKAYRKMGAAAVNVGCLDLLQGVDFLRQESSQGLPLISANLLDPATKTPIFPPHVIREVAGYRVAFFGLLPPESGPEISPAIRRANEGKILISDPIEAARQTVQSLKAKADLIILLSDLGLFKDQAVAKAVPGIHFILGGHEGRFTRRADRAGTAFAFQSSIKGMYVGNLRLTLESVMLPFKDEGEAQQIEERISGLDMHLRGLQANRQRQSGPDTGNLDRTIQDLTRQKSALQEELKRVKETSSQGGNRFLFSLEPLDKGLPENEEVKKWIAEAGIDKD